MSSNFTATNRKAFRDYFFEKKWECGIALKGAEVKSIRAGLVNFKNSYAVVEKGEIFLHDLHINPYREASYMNPAPDRPRKLLLHKKEISKITTQVQSTGLTLIPTKLYINNRGLVKVELALGRGKKQFDKRESIKKRTIERGLKRALRVRRR